MDAKRQVDNIDLDMIASEFGYTKRNDSPGDTDEDDDVDGKDLNRLSLDFDHTDFDQHGASWHDSNYY